MREPKDFNAPSCAQVGGDFWYAEKDADSDDLNVISDYRFAKSVCDSCIHKSDCAEWGILNEEHGMWGGLTPRQRREIRRQRRIYIKENRSA